VGKEAARMVYAKGAKVYMMARSEQKTLSAMEEIKAAAPNSKGELIYQHLDLSDLESIKVTAEQFLRKEQQLHVLINNAGVGYPDKGSVTKQGYELQLGVNCIGSFSLTKYLTPTLVSTAKVAPRNTVRVVWVSSSAAEGITTKGFMENLPNMLEKSSVTQYFTSKLGNYLHATAYANRYKADGVISVSLNPGNLDSDFWRTQGPFLTWILRKTVLYPAVNGAYTVIFSGFSPEVTLEKTGTHSEYPFF
jgi:retinol dehydrogenase 12